MKPFRLDETGWEVCAHKHTPMGTIPDLSDSDEWPWMPAALPFDAISWLHQSGSGPDPFVGFNDASYAWTEDVDWVLRKSFRLPEDFFDLDEDAILKLQDIDCYFESFLNGVRVGSGKNQFRIHTFDVEDQTLNRDGENELLIYIRSARNITSMLESAYGQLPAGFDTGRVHARRCQSLTGWDWTPRLSSVSLLTPPVFTRHTIVQISSPYVSTPPLMDIEPGQGKIDHISLLLSFELQSRRRASGELTVHVSDLSTGQVVYRQVEQIEIKPKLMTLRKTLEIERASLWWPLGMGSQPLYKVEVDIKATDKLGQFHELSVQSQFGIRHATVERQKDEKGESFIPMINGQRVFCRGANWIPVSVLASQATSRQYSTLLSAAVASGMNCLRVWGGGIYETDEFYSWCDRSGMLIWQDFMFTCAAYPTYREFLDEVEAEATYQVTRLRNHPCLLLWCGNNENEWLHQTGDLKKGNEQRIIGETIWSHLIRQVVEDLDPGRIYHQSSPFGKSKTDVNDEQSGDRHNWDAWSGWQSSDAYLLDNGRFITEFGFQAIPSIGTVSQFAPFADSINHPDLLHHQKMIEGQERIARYTAAHFETPNGLKEWSEVSQQLQAEVLRRAVEHWRRNRFNTAGCLIWQLHDAYTAISWSLLDYYRRPKLAWNESRRFFAPVLLSMELLINGEEVSTIPPEYWPGYKPVGDTSFPTAGGDPVTCKMGSAQIQVRLYLINDTAVYLDGNVVVEFRRKESAPTVLDSIAVEVNPNEMAVVLTHDIDKELLQDIRLLTVHASFEPNERTRDSLSALGNQVRENQLKILQESEHLPLFSEDAGLNMVMAFVEPKYYKGDMYFREQ